MKKGTMSTLLIVIIVALSIFRGVVKMRDYLSTTPSTEAINAVGINETVADEDGVEFCVTNVSNAKKVGADYAKVKTDNNFVIVDIKITNNSSEPYDVNGLNFLLLKGEEEYEYDEETLFAFDNYLYVDTINPNLSEKYTIVYETPTTTKKDDYMLKIEPIGFSDDGSVYISLK